ncbi:MAG: thioredoxin [Bacteroidaceae bacterium]|nr:thioredoxin [Bacteroidaceae bacterium]MBR4590033.1 thioredoxin [Bacteroidaceae bacterium]
MEITSENYNEIISQSKPVVLDFWATWCGPCRKIAPIVEELAEAYSDQVIIGKVNVEEDDDLASKYGIRNIPTLLFIKNGEVIDKFVGAATKDVIEEKIKALL